MRIVGIHDGHNSAVSLLVDGQIKGLLQEERLLSIKNYEGFPRESLVKILEINGLKLPDIDFFVFNGNHIAYPTDRLGNLEIYEKSSSLKSVAKSLLKNTLVYDIYKLRRKEDRIKQLLSLGSGIERRKIRFVEHHLAHASAAYYGCPWINSNEEVLILTQDGSGDGLSGTVNIGNNGKIERIASIKKEDSLGRIYATVTFMLGMVPLEHEYKLMGLAPYASPSGRETSYKVFKDLLVFPKKDSIIWVRKKGFPPIQRIYPYLREKTELHRFDSIAAGLQQFTEEMLVRWVKNCIKKTGIHKVVLSGGTFMNVKANQKIYELPEVEKLFIFPSCGDETNTIGAAYNVYYGLNADSDIKGIKHLYYGPDETDDQNCLKFLREQEKKKTIKFKYKYKKNIEIEVAKLLAKEHIVARCKGPVEFGARALGNRSILSDASDLRKITEINNMIKKRDFWMPFAPVVLKERSKNYIINPKNMEAPFMVITFNATEKYTEFIGGVQQIDRTTRPQIIDKETNKEYYRIVKEYEKLTGKGILINTSFNLHGFPIVYGPKEALYVFENSGLKYLALGNYLVQKM